MSRTPAQAIQAIQAQIARHANIGVGECQLNAHEVYGIGAGAASAYIAWLNAKYKHTDLASAPEGAFIYMDGGMTMVSGHPAGHVMIKAENGKFYTPGGPADPDHWYLTTMADLRAGWPWHHYVGWSEDNNGVRVGGLAPIRKAPPKPPAPAATPNVDQAVVATKRAVKANSGHKKKSLKRALGILKKWSAKY